MLQDNSNKEIPAHSPQTFATIAYRNRTVTLHSYFANKTAPGTDGIFPWASVCMCSCVGVSKPLESVCKSLGIQSNTIISYFIAKYTSHEHLFGLSILAVNGIRMRA